MSISPAVQNLLRWRNSPVEFALSLWPFIVDDKERWAWQSQFLKSLVEEDRISVRSGHGVGKTSGCCVIPTLWWLLTRAPNALVLITANSQDQLRDNNWAEIRRWVGKLPAPLKTAFDISSDHIKLVGMDSCFATARTASKDNPEALQGLHEENMLIIVDEASGIDDIVFEVGAGSLSTPGAKLIMTGNPTRNSGYFYDSFHRLSDGFKTFVVNSEDIPSASGHIKDIISKYGRDSNAYKVRVLGEFPDSDDQSVIPLDLLEAAKVRDVSPLNVMPVWGLDVARMGNCKTALVKRHGNFVPKDGVKTLSKRDTMEVAGWTMHEYEVCPIGDKPAMIMVDAVGLGAGVADRLMELGLPVGVINVGEIASGRERFANLRAECYWSAREWLEQRNCRIESDELCAELSKPTYSFTSAGKIRIETKEQMLSRAIPSPDIADAFVLTFAGADRRKEHDLYEKRPKTYWKNSTWAA